MKRLLQFLVPVCLIGLVFWLWRSQTEADDETSEAAVVSAGAAASGSGSGANRPAKRLLPRNEELLRQPKASVAGTVADEGGKPIAGAQVCATANSSEVAPTIDVPCARTTNDGRYRIEGLLGVAYSVNASAPTFQPAAFRNGKAKNRVRLIAGRERNGVDIVLRSGGVKVMGIVRDISGGVIEDAVVSTGGWGGDGKAYGRTGADGAFALWSGPGQARITAKAEGYAEESQSGAAPGFTFELFLTPESILVGQVVDVATGEPVVGARVTADDASEGFSFGSDAFAFSDEGGMFRLAGLQPGIYKPHAQSEQGYGESELSVHLALGATSEPVEVRLHPAVSVEGVILIDAGEERAPCQRGSAVLTHAVTKDTQRASVRAEGQVQLLGVLPGTYEVQAYCDGYLSEDGYGELEVTDEPPEKQQWVVTAGQSIRGRVVGADADVLASARVSARTSGGAARARMNWGSDDEIEADGAFEITGLSPGSMELTVSGDGIPRALDPLTIELAEGESLEDVEVEVTKGATILGRVQDASGAPIVGAGVRADGPGRRWSPATSDDDGRFELKGLVEGTHRVSATKKWKSLRKPNTTDDDTQGESVEVSAGEVAEVTLVVEAQDKAIRGRVLDEEGSPVVDAFVRAERESDSATAAASRNVSAARWGGWDEQPVMTDEDGAFEIEGLTAADYTLRAWRRGGGEGFAEHVKSGSDSVEIGLEGTGKIEGVVTFGKAGAPSQFSVNIRDEKSGFSRKESFFETDGRFACDELPPGDYQLTAEAEGGSGTAEAKLIEGQEQGGVKIELRKHVAVKGKVVDAETGEPVPGLMVSIQLKEGGSWNFSFGGGGDKRNQTNEQGEFELDSVPTGAVLVTLIPRGFGSKTEYSFGSRPATVGDADPFDMPPIKVARLRVKRGEVAGELGYKLKEREAGTSWTEGPLVVGFVEPGGPAAAAGLEVGAVITSVAGQSVTGDDRSLYYTLSTVKAGETVKLGVEEGDAVSIVARKKR